MVWKPLRRSSQVNLTRERRERHHDFGSLFPIDAAVAALCCRDPDGWSYEDENAQKEIVRTTVPRWHRCADACDIL
jgi:hypothetical protein